MPYAKDDTENQALVRAFKQELEKLGWTEGRTVQFDEHWTTDDMGLVRDHAANLMAAKPDVVVATGGRVIPILMQLTNSIPIVLPGGGDPVRVGYAKTLAHPGGNVTGFALFELSLMGKSLEILKQIAPTVARVALIYNPDNPNSIMYRQIPRQRLLRLASSPSTFPFTNSPTLSMP
jgi:putative tryptophan/tyrosine transport system substrate-binding protein